MFVDWLDDLHQIVQAAGWSRFILLGHSWGAPDRQRLCRVFPEQVARLICWRG